jgi:hypothetical protein
MLSPIMAALSDEMLKHSGSRKGAFSEKVPQFSDGSTKALILVQNFTPVIQTTLQASP